MRKILVIVFVILSLNLFGVSINKYGHIQNNEKKNIANYTIENNEFYATFKMLK